MPVLPAHEVGRRPILAEDLQNLGVTGWLALAMASDDKTIAWAGFQSPIAWMPVRQGTLGVP